MTRREQRGMGIPMYLDVLSLMFIYLKLEGSIDWEWWQVLLPQIVPFTVSFVVTFARGIREDA